MLFIGLTLLLLVVGVLVMLGLARIYRDRSLSELLDWQPVRKTEQDVQNEVDDVRQMIEAQNALRRKRGALEITEADAQRHAQEDQRLRAQGSGPFARRITDQVGDEETTPAHDEELRQMLEAQNALRRKRGAEEIDADDVHRLAREDEDLRSRGSGPFAREEGDEGPERPRRRRKRA